jgi:hypothetical protein
MIRRNHPRFVAGDEPQLTAVFAMGGHTTLAVCALHIRCSPIACVRVSSLICRGNLEVDGVRSNSSIFSFLPDYSQVGGSSGRYTLGKVP